MGEGFQFLDIVLFAMVAAFLVLRLRSVLGRRTGNEQPRQDRMTQRSQEQEPDGNVVELPNRRDERGEEDSAFDLDPDDPLSAGLTRIKIADNSFNPAEFVDGARGAFEMIVGAFAAGDKETLQNLLAEDVYEGFEDAIEQREAAAQTLETTIISLDTVDIIEADMDGADAMVTLKFVSEQVNVTKDAEGRVIEGDPNQVTEITDIWTFSRNTRSRDPNWKLVETRSQN